MFTMDRLEDVTHNLLVRSDSIQIFVIFNIIIMDSKTEKPLKRTYLYMLDSLIQRIVLNCTSRMIALGKASRYQMTRILT